MSNRLHSLVLALLVAWSAATGPAQAQAPAQAPSPPQAATTRNAEALRADPSPTAASVGNVAANARVQVVERKGFWARISSGNVSGWLKLSSLSLEPSGTASAAPSLAGLASGRTGSGNIVSTAGTRGLSAEDLRSAQPDMNAVASVKAMSVSGDAASRYAQDGGLKTRQLTYVSASGAPAK
jgi:hypothetical protein